MSDITRSEAIKTLKEHLSHWERLLQEHICEEQEGIDTISALKLAIASLETDEAYQLEYERTTKNDLGVDCISRADAIHAVSEALKHTFVEYEDIANKVISKLPSVTPQEPKIGHWISHIEHCKQNNLLPSGLGSYFWCSECDCGIDSKNFARVNYNYCPNCGAKMVEPKESEGK